jgi:hypothetical protein
MFNISYNGIITVNRGDSFRMPLVLNVGTKLDPKRFELTENCYVYIGVMEPNQPFENALIRKTLTYKDVNSKGDLIVKFSPQDTQCVLPGKYYYQVKLQVLNPDDPDDYEVHTIIDKTQFFVLE